MPEASMLKVGLAFLIPLGYVLIAVGGLSEERAREMALGVLAALALAAIGYVAVGFALEYGGIGLISTAPGLDGLIWEWSALGETWGAGWGMVGLAGWGMTGPAGTPGAYALALAALPWVSTAAAIPLVCLRGRIPAWAAGLLGLLVGALIYPVAGNWIWGNGWLANLGSNLGLGHGLVDAGGAGLVHLLGAAVAAAGMIVFLSRLPKPIRDPALSAEVPLPPVHLPLLAVVGAGLLVAGGLAWTIANPLLNLDELGLMRLALNGVLAAAAGALLPLCYTWFVTGRADPLMAARGLAAGTVAIAATAPFVAPWAALAIGGIAGLLTPFIVYFVDHILRWDDPTAALTVHGLGGALGLLAVGVFADGLTGQGWNGVGAPLKDLAGGSYLGVTGQGVTGLLAVPPFQPDWPGQMQAQIIGFLALALFGFFVAWLFIAPPALLLRLLQRRPVPAGEAPAAGQEIPALAAVEEPVPGVMSRPIAESFGEAAETAVRAASSMEGSP